MLPAVFFFLAASFDESYRAGLFALQSGDLTAAATNLESASKLQPSNGRVWIALAQVYSRSKRTSDANAAAVKAQAFSKTDAVVAETLGVYYQQMLREQRYADAIGLLRNVEDAQSRLALGVAYYGLRRFDDAAGAFLRVIELAPEIEQPYLFLGKFLDQLPARRAAIAKRFAEFAARNPANYAGPFLLAKVQPENAEKLLRKALELNDADPAVHFDLGNVLDLQKRFAEAAVAFERAAKINPSDPATHYRLSRVYARLGRVSDSQAARDLHAQLVKAQDSAK